MVEVKLIGSLIMTVTSVWKQSLLHLFFPLRCAGCGSTQTGFDQVVCIRCQSGLPQTHFAAHAGNPVEKIFGGRIPLVAATAQYYFTKDSGLQRIIHLLKYGGRKDIGIYFGRALGKTLQASGRFNEVDAIIPLPLFAARQKKRGYNQSALLCQGIADILDRPVLENTVIRTRATATQTRKGRIARWENMQGCFRVADPQAMAGLHLLLVDDIITTGATLDACAGELLQVTGTKLSIATLAYAQKI